MLLLCASVCTCGLAGICWRHVLAIEEALLFDGLTHRHVAGRAAVEILVKSPQLDFDSRCSGQRAQRGSFTFCPPLAEGWSDPEYGSKKHFSSFLLFSSASRPLRRCNLAMILHATLFDPDDISWRMYFWTFPRMNNIPAIKRNPSIFNPPSPCDCWGQACQMVAQPMSAWNEVDRFQPQNKQAIESWHCSAFHVIPVMSMLETLEAFSMGSGRRERGLKKVQKPRETCSFRF